MYTLIILIISLAQTPQGLDYRYNMEIKHSTHETVESCEAAARSIEYRKNDFVHLNYTCRKED